MNTSWHLKTSKAGNLWRAVAFSAYLALKKLQLACAFYFKQAESNDIYHPPLYPNSTLLFIDFCNPLTITTHT